MAFHYTSHRLCHSSTRGKKGNLITFVKHSFSKCDLFRVIFHIIFSIFHIYFRAFLSVCYLRTVPNFRFLSAGFKAAPFAGKLSDDVRTGGLAKSSDVDKKTYILLE